jgi:hypothetical protein
MTAPDVDEQCADRAKLARAVTGSIAEVYRQKGAYDNAKAQKEDRIILWAALRVARAAQLNAKDAFRDHVQAHGCKK